MAGKPTTNTQFTVDIHAGRMTIKGMFNDCQPKTIATVTTDSLSTVFYAIKTLRLSRYVRCSYTCAGIRNSQMTTFIINLPAQCNAPIFPGITNGIGEQV